MVTRSPFRILGLALPEPLSRFTLSADFTAVGGLLYLRYAGSVATHSISGLVGI
jgi:hypothetical protein